MNIRNEVMASFLGLAVGDALGVPVEFESRDYLKKNPVQDMIGHGTYNKPPGTWSDDSSLSFCLAESLINGYNLKDICQKFVDWYDNAYWTADNEVFDIGITTRTALSRFKKGESPQHCGLNSENSNGNGSLMRISPLPFYLFGASLAEITKKVSEVSSVTHAHAQSVFGCIIYVVFMQELIKGKQKDEALSIMRDQIQVLIRKNPEFETVRSNYALVLGSDFSLLKEKDIKSSGYIVHSLEAALWCFMTENDYKSTVLKAVNLGEDTDTIAAIAGSMSGLYYGSGQIPEVWLQKLARRQDIEGLAYRFSQSLKGKEQ